MRIAAVVVALFCITPLLADEVADSRRLQQEALAAHKEKKEDVFLEKIREASKLRPQQPTLLMQLAIALAANGRQREALGVIDRVAAMGFVYDINDAEFAPLRDQPLFAAAARHFADNAKPIGTARPALTIDRLGVLPEGIAYDARRKRWLISSVRSGAVLTVDGKGTVGTLVDVPWGVFGMAVDERRGVLWATTTAMAQVEDFRAQDKGKSGLLKIDLATGRVLDTLRLLDDAPHTFADVAIGANGEVYVSDSQGPIIHRVVGAVLEPFIRGPFVSMQGIAPAGKVLYVADYTKGLFVVDLRTRDVHSVRVPPNASLLGVDALVAVDEQTLIATQNGTNPNRILRIRLAPGGLAVSSVETLLANVPEMGDPTLGVVVGKRFYFNANAQWNHFGEDGRIAAPLQLKPAVVLSVPVD